ncbi:MAG: hypothetical protein K1X92_05365 [Bacteroidia bacterium]|nr:hypothetical protein [Bacteroidia bacterium]
MRKSFLLLSVTIIIALYWLVSACGTPPVVPPGSEKKVVFKFHFDSTQARLNNLGMPAGVAAGRGALSPRVNEMAAHYIELSPNMLTPLGGGEVLYTGKETTAGGANAIIFDSLKKAGEGDIIYSIPISSVKAGTFEYLRVSLAYQNFDIKFKYTYNGTIPMYFDGTLASFVGYNTYIKNYTLKTQTITVNDDKLQGYWGFEIPPVSPYLPTGYSSTGQAPGTTVVNPIASTSPIPAGSCVVTGKFAQPLVITGDETEDIIVTVSLSTNKSFEWIENNADGWFEPAAGEVVVDMGIRGMVPTYTK